MARPLAATCTVTTGFRGPVLRVTYNFRKVKYPVSTLIRGERLDIDVAGYIKRSRRTDADACNQVIELIRERLKQAHNILFNNAKEITEATIAAEYKRLTKEYHESLEAAQEAAARKERISRKAGIAIEIVHNEIKEVVIPTKLDEIRELEDQLRIKRNELNNLKRETQTYEDDLLVTWLHNYMYRKGTTTLAASTIRTFTSFINTVKRFDENARLQDIDDSWLQRFQDWMITTPSATPKYSMKIDPSGTIGATGKVKKIKDKIIGWLDPKPRKNSSIAKYLIDIKGVLKYYEIHDDRLPVDCKVNTKYKRFEVDLKKKQENVVALEEEELAEILSMEHYTKNLEKARLLLLFMCSTSLRYSDAVKVKPSDIEDGYISKYLKKGENYNIHVSIPLNQVSKYVLEKCGNDISKIAMDDDYAKNLIREICSSLDSMRKEITAIDFNGNNEIELIQERWKFVGTHSGRRTYINLAMNYRLPLHDVCAITGHTSLKNLEAYAQRSKKKIKEHTLNILEFPKNQ